MIAPGLMVTFGEERWVVTGKGHEKVALMFCSFTCLPGHVRHLTIYAAELVIGAFPECAVV